MDNVERTKKNLKRAGKGFWDDIFCTQYKYVTAENALLIFNTLAIPLETIILIASSHSMVVDEEGFHKLLEEQKEEHRNCRQCDAQM